MELLLQHGAFIGFRDYCYRTAHHFAAKNDSTEAMGLLLQQGLGDGENENGASALRIAAKNGNIKIMKMLPEHCVPINGRDKHDQTPLLTAAKNDRTIAVEFLLKHGASVQPIDRFGQTVLLLAAFKGKAEVMKLLLQHGASVHDRDKESRTALHLAAASKNIENYGTVTTKRIPC